MKIMILILLITATAPLLASDIVVKVYPEKQNAINPRIFGHFLERPSWQGEFGIEDAVLAETGNLDPRVLEKLKGIKIPVLRFPGGTDVDYLDWTDMIDLPGRKSRPVSPGHNAGDTVTNRFGYDEFFALTRELDCENIIPLNFYDAFLKRKPLKEAVLHSLGLVAYCNAQPGQNLPEGMPDWGSVRQANGNIKSFNCQYFQLGNETWFLWRRKREDVAKAGVKDAYSWYIECSRAYIDMIEAIDPDAKIIVDYINEELFERMHDKFGERIDYYVFHAYLPWAIKEENVEKNGEKIPISRLCKKEVWNAFVSTPNDFDDQGRVIPRHKLIDLARANGVKIAVTEWNWNGWWEVDNPPLQSHFAQGLGAAGFLLAFLRASDAIEIACQSMLVGSSWDITGIHVDKKGRTPPVYYPTALVTSFYAEHHGSHLLKSEEKGIPAFRQPLRLNNILPKEKVAVLDFVATGSDKSVAIFCINRDIKKDHQAQIDLSEFTGNLKKGSLIVMTGALDDNEIEDVIIQGYTKKDIMELQVGNKSCTVSIPARSLSVIKLQVD